MTGPNGSGKSNILDGVLFCLGLANSRGMRADRLPDLVNSGMLKAGKSAETTVSVRFDLTDWQPDAAEEGLESPEDGPWIQADANEWTVTRKLRVMPGGSYSSSYSADGEPCNLQQLQTQLRRLRIDPEGSNVVMQGDVTRIVSMSNRDRRGLIDELAGVALFDTRIEQSRRKLDDVQESQDRCRIVEQELLTAKQRLEKDCAKARAYQELREQVQCGRQQELVLAFEAAEAELTHLNGRQQQLSEQKIRDSEAITEKEKTLSEATTRLKTLQENVKALGEDKLLSVQAELAGLDPQNRELERQSIQHQQEGERLQGLRHNIINRRNQLKVDSEHLNQANEPEVLKSAEQTCRDAEAAVEIARRRLGISPGDPAPGWMNNVKGQRDAPTFRQRSRLSRKSNSNCRNDCDRTRTVNLNYSWNATKPVQKIETCKTSLSNWNRSGMRCWNDFAAAKNNCKSWLRLLRSNSAPAPDLKKSRRDWNAISPV